MTRLILWIAGGFALLSALYLGVVSLVFAPPKADTAAPTTVVEAAPPNAAFDEAPYVAPAAPPPPAPVAARRSSPSRSSPSRSAVTTADSSTAAPDTAAVRRLTVELARQTRAVAHVGKPVAKHVATGQLGLGDDGCRTTDDVKLCLSTDPVGGWKVVGSSEGYTVTARGPATLGESLRISTQ